MFSSSKLSKKRQAPKRFDRGRAREREKERREKDEKERKDRTVNQNDERRGQLHDEEIDRKRM